MNELIPVLEPFLQLLLALTLGGVLGLERTLAGKTAGLRTFGLAALGSCLFIIVASEVNLALSGVTPADPLRVAAGIISGIGFIGAGLIIFKDGSKVHGLTTAAGLWVASAIGIALGFKLYLIGLFTTLLTLFAFTALWFIERRFESFTATKIEPVTHVIEEESKEA